MDRLEKELIQAWVGMLDEKYLGFSWPPYPREFMYIESIKKIWKYKKNIKILRMNEHFDKISIGDQFNAIIMPKKRKKGLKAPERYHRIFQLFSNTKKIGRIVYREISGIDTIKKGEIMKNRVHRVQILKIDERTYDCVTLAHTFNKDNLIENLTNCYYQKNNRPPILKV